MDQHTFDITKYEELIGNKKQLLEWYNIIKNVKLNEMIMVYGPSGVGKSKGISLLIKEFGYNGLFLDTNNCSDGKELLDRITKFHTWMDLGDKLKEIETLSQKIIVIDEVESLVKLDRNVLNHIFHYKKVYKESSLPIVLLGNIEIIKKLGDIKNAINYMIRLHQLQDIDIFLFLKKRLPKNKIKATELMKISEEVKGNIYAAILSVKDRCGEKKGSIKHLFVNYSGDEQRNFDEIFECNHPAVITRLLQEDNWMHPLKVQENSIKLLDKTMYVKFMEQFLEYEIWNHRVKDNINGDTIDPLYYLGMNIHNNFQAVRDQKIESMDFSKLLSYISTQKKYIKMVYDKVDHLYPVEDIGMFWIQGYKEGSKRSKDKNDENFL